MSSKNILVVEDSPVMQRSIKTLLEREGYAVACAANGRDALSYLHSSDCPALILLDLGMPVMDGWELRDELKRDNQFAGIPVVVISGVPGEAVECASYVNKPFEPAELLHAVREATSRKTDPSSN
jgi:CheY-like chemotaxis protein